MTEIIRLNQCRPDLSVGGRTVVRKRDIFSVPKGGAYWANFWIIWISGFGGKAREHFYLNEIKNEVTSIGLL